MVEITLYFGDDIFKITDPSKLGCFNLNLCDGARITETLNRAEIQDRYSPANYDKQLEDLLRGGLKIEAIKLRRTVTGEGLKQAKDYVDALQNRMREF